MRIYSRFDVPPRRSVKCDPKEGRTKQSFAKDADINVIMAKYEKTGVLGSPGDSGRVGRYGDFTDGLDFMEVQERLLRARSAFLGLPAKVRARFSNEPAYLLDFLADSGNRDEAVALGLIPKAVQPLERPAEEPPAKLPAVPEAGRVVAPEGGKGGGTIGT